MLTLAAAAALFYVIDGDTVVRDGAHIRIANIDAPEIRHAACDAELRLANIARSRLIALLAAGRVEIHVGDPRTSKVKDRFGRTLATLTVNGVDVGNTLIAERLARPWTGRKKPWCQAGGDAKP